MTTRIFSKTIKALFIAGGLAVAAASVLVHPAGEVKATYDSEPLLKGSGASTKVIGILEKACQNCHSQKTEWPWYSYVAPFSWIIENEVSKARGHMDLTQWQAYSSSERIEILTKIAPIVSNRAMPPQRYVALHSEAQLSAAEREEIARWAHEERRTLKQARLP